MLLKVSILFIHTACGANILGIIPTPSISHQLHFFDFWKELSLRGHKVTVVTTDPQRNENLTNLKEIDIKWAYKFFENISDIGSTGNAWNFHIYIHNLETNMMHAQLSYEKVQDLIINRDRHFDVLLVEAIHPEYLSFSEIYNCPTILISSLDVYSHIHYKFGNTFHPVVNPNLCSPWVAPLNFVERVSSTIYSVYTWIFYSYFAYPSKTVVMQKYFNTTTTIERLLDEVDMLFINSNPLLTPIRAVGPTTISVDSMRRMAPLDLPEELKEYLDSATNGFIYFSLGSNMKSKDLKKESLRAIVETLGELPYKVLWKFEAEADAIPNKPENVKLIKWAPQLEILAHPKLKLFVTQGGLQSMEEAIHNEVPCVVIPFLADQEQNARLMKNKGFATTVSRSPQVKKEELKSAILEVINNPTYKNAVKNLKRLADDTPMTGLQRAIWWTEYVIRNKGAKHMRVPAADLPLYQYYLLDVLGFLLAVGVLALLIFCIVLKRTCGLLKIVILNRPVLVSKKSQ